LRIILNDRKIKKVYKIKGLIWDLLFFEKLLHF